MIRHYKWISRFPSRSKFACVSMIALALCGCHPQDEARVNAELQAASERQKNDSAKSQDESPEAVLRVFIKALAESDETTIRQTAINRPGMEILWLPRSTITNLPPTDRARILSTYDSAPLTRMKIGETYTFKTKQEEIHRTLDENDINDGRVMLKWADTPVPFVVIKTNGKWLVDPGGLIALRQTINQIQSRQK